MGTRCTEGVKRTRRDNEREESLNNYRSATTRMSNKIDRLTRENKKLKKKLALSPNPQ